jgi:PAS domain S-box-containing protein
MMLKMLGSSLLRTYVSGMLASQNTADPGVRFDPVLGLSTTSGFFGSVVYFAFKGMRRRHTVSAPIQHGVLGPFDRRSLMRYRRVMQTSATTRLLLPVAVAASFLLPQATAASSVSEIASILNVLTLQETAEGRAVSSAMRREPYKGYFLAGLSLISLQTLLIGGLVFQWLRRRKLETELAITSERLRLAVEATKQIEEKLHLREERIASTVASLMDAVIEADQDRRIVLLNTVAEEMFDSGALQAIGTSIKYPIPQRLPMQHEEGTSRSAAFGARSRTLGSPSALLAVQTDGQEFPVNASVSPSEANGEAQLTAIIRDITVRGKVEEAVNSLSGSLIKAQEEERRRIAREIHDDYNQRLAVIAIDLEELATNGAPLNIEAGKRLHGLWKRVSELSEDLHALSHRLHSSTLENLGVIAGVRAFCEEFGEQQKMQIVFAHENVPHSVSGDVSLCLFRIVQESLRNVKRHSGASRAEVRLELINEMLHLSVVDHGTGFNSNERSNKRGIGIQSMEERLRLLGGRLEVRSSLRKGTTIDAWLPLMVAAGP